MVFLSAVSPGCWSICRRWSRGIWEPLFHTNELHDFQPTISMFSALEGVTDELLCIATRAGTEWASCHVHKGCICVNVCVWGRAQKYFFFSLTGPQIFTCPLHKIIYLIFSNISCVSYIYLISIYIPLTTWCRGSCLAWREYKTADCTLYLIIQLLTK